MSPPPTMTTTRFLCPPILSNTPSFCNPISDPSVSISFLLIPCSFVNPPSIFVSIPSFSVQPPASSSSTSSGTASDGNGGTEAKALAHGNTVTCHAPWMRGSLVPDPSDALAVSASRNRKSSPVVRASKESEDSLSHGVSGGRGKKAMKKIFEGIEKLQDGHHADRNQREPPEMVEFGASFWGFRKEGGSKSVRKMPWERDERVVVFRRVKKEKVVTAAELTLEASLLERLRGEAARMRRWVKAKKAGVTETVVEQIRWIWKNNELAMLKFDLPLCLNMDRAREIVELKTGGLVIWTKKDVLVVYRGCSYKPGFKSISKNPPALFCGREVTSSGISYQGKANVFERNWNQFSMNEMIGAKEGEEAAELIHGSLYERETDRLLDGLGPRFVDWWYHKPLPVDADKLPEVVPGFMSPFRICPQKEESKLRDEELTYLRKLSRSLPTHFVLGRNKKLQGLAAAILKLWEKCHIAKIAVKMGTPNTNNELMASELKNLTGGVVLLSNKFLVIIYRGKDFLPQGVANLVAKREIELQSLQLQEEAARVKAMRALFLADERSTRSNTNVGTLSEFQNIQSEHGEIDTGDRAADVQFEAEKERLSNELRNQENKLFLLKLKIAKSYRELAKLNSAWSPAERDEDQEILTEEEREGFRNIGLKMDRTLVLGRRGVFDGVIEGIHQHWKHREIVKVITMQRTISKIIYTAKLLEVESGGVLVSIEKLREGHGIVIYRGKNYKRPLKLLPSNLLSKREALSRSLEMQRLGSLKFFANQRQQAVYNLKLKLAQMVKDGTD